MVYSINREQVKARGCVLLMSCMTAQKSEFIIFLGIILSAFKRSNTEMHVSDIVTVSQ